MRVPFDRDRKGRWLGVAFLAGLLLAAGLQNRYDAGIDYFGDRSTFVSLPSGKALKALSFGYRNLAADMLFIWSIQLYSTYYLTNRFDFLERVYDTITDITPQYKEPYVIGALIMVYDAGDVPMALRLLEKGARNNPDDWRFDQDAGYYCYKYLKDYPRAEQYYNQAAAKPGAPGFIRRMKAHLLYMNDDPQAAYGMWLDIYRNARDVLERDSAYNHLYQIKAEADLGRLRNQIAAFRAKYRRWPATLDELLSTGLSRSLPTDFSGKSYLYDPDSGTVQAARVFRWKRR
jgi:tetratricopeptide (TPR) repeat protein